MIKTVMHGAGQMAQGVLALLPEHAEFELIALVSRNEPEGLKTTSSGQTMWFSCLQDVSASVDLVIDFTLPGGPAIAADWCRQNNVALLSGTTGLSDQDKAALEKASRQVPVLWASNLSRGIAMITALVRQAATAIGEQADFTISDIHHQHKVDAPSGTALTLAEAVMEGRKAFDRTALAGQESVPQRPEEHEDNEIAFISVRKGDVTGEHTVSLEMPGEIIEISHKARDRSVFAEGALNAGAWLSKQKSGYYSTADWLKIG